MPASGRFACVSFWIEQLPPDCGLNDLKVVFDGAPGSPCYIGPPEWGGVYQLNVQLPRGIRTGLVPVELLWLGAPLCPTVWLRVLPPGVMVPRVCSVTDGANPVGGAHIGSGVVKLVAEDLADAESVSAVVDGRPVEDLKYFPTDAPAGRFEINFRLPADLAHGAHQIELQQGARSFPPVAIDVVWLPAQDSGCARRS